MRMDKLTTKFQAALADAQSLAVGRDNQYIEPVHLMAALLDQQGGTARPLLEKAGANVAKLRSELAAALDRTPEGGRIGRRGAARQRSQQAAECHRQARPAARRSVHLERAVRARGLR